MFYEEDEKILRWFVMQYDWLKFFYLVRVEKELLLKGRLFLFVIFTLFFRYLGVNVVEKVNRDCYVWLTKFQTVFCYWVF